MSIYSCMCLLAGITNLGLALFVLWKNHKRCLNWIFSLLGLSLSSWSFGLYGMSVADTVDSAVFWMRFGSLIHWVPIFYFHFSMRITKDFRPKNRILLWLGYFLTVILQILDLLGLIVEPYKSEVYNLGYYPKAKPLFLLFGLLFVTLIGRGVGLLWKRYKLTTYLIEKNRLKHLLIAITISLLGGISNFLLLSGISIYPIGHLTNVFYTLVVAYALVQYRLMDIKPGIILQRCIIYALVILGVLLVVLLGGPIILERIFPHIGTPIFVALFLAFTLVTIIFRFNIIEVITYFLIVIFILTVLTLFLPKEIALKYGLTALILIMFMFILSTLRERIQLFIDRKIFKKSDKKEQEGLIKFIKDTIPAINDKDILLTTTINSLNSLIQFDKAVVFLLDKTMREYKVAAIMGPEVGIKKDQGIFKDNEPIIGCLKQENRTLLKDEIELNPEFEQERQELINGFDKAKVGLLIPIIYHEELYGILGLGRKIGNKPYSEDDLTALSTVCDPIPQALENIKLGKAIQEAENTITVLFTLHRISELVQKEGDLDKIIFLLLTGVTYGKGVGFNRALLFLFNEQERVLEYKMGIGAENAEEAHKIWEEIVWKNITLDECIAQYDREKIYAEGINKVVKGKTIPIENPAIFIERKSAFTTNPEEYPEIKDALLKLDLIVFAIAPLFFGDKFRGIIIADNKYEEKLISNYQLELLSILANQGVIAIRNWELYMKKNKELKMLNEISNRLNTIRDKKKSLNEIVDIVIKELKVNLCYIYLYDEKEKKLKLATSDSEGLPEELNQKAYYYNLGEGLTGSILLWKEPIVVENVFKDPRYIGKYRDNVEELKKSVINACLGIAIRKDGKKLGVITVDRIRDSEDDDKTFTAEEVNLIKTLSDQMAIALDNIWLIEELRQADKAKIDLLSNLDHVLGQSLTTVKGMTQMLLQGDIKDYEKQQSYFEDIFRANEFFIRLLRNAFDLMNIETGRLEVKKDPLQLKGLIEEAVSVCKLSASMKGINININVPDNLPLINGNDYMITSILGNLIFNAIIYSDKGTITITVEENENYIHLAIKDEGIGISSEELPHIFEKNFRGERARIKSKGIKGRGIGLASAKFFIETHEGDIKVESEVDKGSTFIFTLPKYK